MPLYKTTALVLRRKNLGEVDQIVTLLSPDKGKIRAVAKGVRKPTSRFSGKIEIFNEITLLLAVGRNLDVITQAELKETFPLLRENLLLFALCSYLMEVVDTFLAEPEACHQIFHLVLTTMRLLHETGVRESAIRGGVDGRSAEEMVYRLQAILRGFELKLLALVGYCPYLDNCVSCQGDLAERASGEQPPLPGYPQKPHPPASPSAIFFSPALGGALCSSCRERDQRALVLRRETVMEMKELLTLPLGEVRRVRKSLLLEMERGNRAFIQAKAGRSLRSIQFLDEVSTGPLL